MNAYPTVRQEEVLRDLAQHPEDPLSSRAQRLRITRSAVYQTLAALEVKELTSHGDAGEWWLTARGRKWLGQVHAGAVR